MKELTSVFEELLFSTVRIEVDKLKNGNIETSIGTGSFFDYELNDKHYPFLVTNRHVVENSITGRLTFTLADENKPLLGDVYTISIPNFGQKWIYHPNKDIDVGITPFASIENLLVKENVEIFYRSTPQKSIPSQDQIENEIDAIEDIIFIGYPSNVYDTKNLLPIVRKGITATPVSVDFENTPTFLIDAAVFRGSSGSPVFLYNKGAYMVKGERTIKAGIRIFFLGIVSKVIGKKLETIGKVMDFPTELISVSVLEKLLNLGIVYKSYIILDMIESFLKEE